MKHLSPAECIEIANKINPNLTWYWNDHFDTDEPPFYAINPPKSSHALAQEFRNPPYFTLPSPDQNRTTNKPNHAPLGWANSSAISISF